MKDARPLGDVLVPLDVAESGEKILSAVEEIARIGVGEIRLLHVANVRDTLVDPTILYHDREVLDAWRETFDRVRRSVRNHGGGQRHPLDRDHRAVGAGRLLLAQSSPDRTGGT